MRNCGKCQEVILFQGPKTFDEDECGESRRYKLSWKSEMILSGSASSNGVDEKGTVLPSQYLHIMRGGGSLNSVLGMVWCSVKFSKGGIKNPGLCFNNGKSFNLLKFRKYISR